MWAATRVAHHPHPRSGGLGDDSRPGDAEAGGDLAVIEAPRLEHQHLGLPARQVVDMVGEDERNALLRRN